MISLLAVLLSTHAWSADATTYLPKKNEKLICDEHQVAPDGSLYNTKDIFTLKYQGEKFFSRKKVFRYFDVLTTDYTVQADLTIELWDKKKDLLVLKGFHGAVEYLLYLSSRQKDQFLTKESFHIMNQFKSEYVLKNCRIEK